MQNLKLIHLTIFCAAAVLVLLPISYFSINKMTLDLSVSNIVRTDSRTNDTYEKFNNAFQGNTVLFVIAKIDKIFSDKGVKIIYEMSQTLNDIPGISDIKSLTHSARPIKGNFNLDFTKIITFKNFLDLEPKPPGEWEKIKKFTLEYPMSKNIFVSAVLLQKKTKFEIFRFCNVV